MSRIIFFKSLIVLSSVVVLGMMLYDSFCKKVESLPFMIGMTMFTILWAVSEVGLDVFYDDEKDTYVTCEKVPSIWSSQLKVNVLKKDSVISTYTINGCSFIPIKEWEEFARCVSESQHNIINIDAGNGVLSTKIEYNPDNELIIIKGYVKSNGSSLRITKIEIEDLDFAEELVDEIKKSFLTH